MGAETCTPVPRAPQYPPMPGVALCPGSVTVPHQRPCLAAVWGRTPTALGRLLLADRRELRACLSAMADALTLLALGPRQLGGWVLTLPVPGA